MPDKKEEKISWKEVQEKLGQPTPKDKIKMREGFGGKMLSYIDARYVMDVLDDVVGCENWRDEYQVLNGNMFCGLSVRVNGEWITKWDVGSESNIESEKGEVSGAFKRAAVKWQISRDLYDEEPVPKKKSSKSYSSYSNDIPADCIGFGKHKGKAWTEIPTDYLQWLMDSDGTRDDTRALASNELENSANSQEEPREQENIPF